LKQALKTALFKTARPALDLPRYVKRCLAVSVDLSLCIVSVWLAFFLRLGVVVSVWDEGLVAAIISIAIALPLFVVSGLYRMVFRYSDRTVLLKVFSACALYSLFYITIFTVIAVPGVPRTIGIIQPILLFMLVAGVRSFVDFWLGNLYREGIAGGLKDKALIYGCGTAGRQLYAALHDGSKFEVVGFLDDQVQLQGRTLSGKPIFSPIDIQRIVEKHAVSHILLAIPSASRQRRAVILENLARANLMVRTVPSMADLATGEVTFSDLKEPDVMDLLGRQQVPANSALLAKNLTEKTVLVSGAGGSIGSELCRQILGNNPTHLLLVEANEYALYRIFEELEGISALSGFAGSVVPILCNAQDSSRIREVLSTWRPDTIYHAAAYKHVPLVEHNVIEGIRNNIFGTYWTAKIAAEFGVSNFVLVSTDKAVRPTNVMGATKRFAEMILQAMSDKPESKTSFSMVRFGNVLESSGSVIPKFRNQIAMGGPVTVTHPDVNRFFMTIPEAAQLVIQASAMAKGGDVFVLDMGEPVKILDLAERMICLSGLTVKNASTGAGDIEIRFIGLRSGEKLFEELLIGNNPETTEHPKIIRANETMLDWDSLKVHLDVLEAAADKQDVKACLVILKEVVTEFSPQEQVVDWLYAEQLNSRS
jgi:FlaA1/EpsC-like NDP-sugar epimerase